MKKISSSRRKFKYHNADYDILRKEFQKFSEEQVMTMDIQTMWNKFKATIHTLMEKLIPHKTIRRQETQTKDNQKCQSHAQEKGQTIQEAKVIQVIERH